MQGEYASLAPTLLLAQLEALAGKLLEHAPATRLQVSRLAGKVAQVKLVLPRLDVFIQFDSDGVRLTQHCEADITVCIEGTAPALLFQTMQPGPFRAGGGVVVTGDMALAQTLSQLARQLDFDWEDLLSHYVGDITAHEVGKAVRKGASFLGALARKAFTDGRAFLVNEQPLLVERARFDDFSRQVRDTRQHYDRLEARIAQLRSVMEAPAKTADDLTPLVAAATDTAELPAASAPTPAAATTGNTPSGD